MDEPDVPTAGSATHRNPRSRPGTSPQTAQPVQTTEDAAFSAFYRQFVPTLIAFLMWQGARLPEAADIAQDTMAEAYKSWSVIDHPQAWARKVASRMLARLIGSVDKQDLVGEVPERSSLLLPLTDVEAWEQRHEVLRLLGCLPPRQRQVMAWTLDGYAPSDIADELKITAEAVRASLKKARRTLATQAQPRIDNE
jgi:RNA polymerase sigma factor (sigma-70 family)